MTGTTVAARALAAAIEPLIGQVHFAPECHAEYVALGFGPSPGTSGDTHLPNQPAYFASRSSTLGQVQGHVAAATFAVFNPALIAPAVDRAWTLTDAATLSAARRRGAVDQLARILGERPDGVDRAGDLFERAIDPLPEAGRPLFAAHRSHPVPDEPLARMWWLGDALREYRGDSHILAWAGEGLDGAEIGMLSDLYWRTPLRGHTGGRGWSVEQMDAALDRLRTRGLVDGDTLSPAGSTLRESIETRTDALLQPALTTLGDDVDELITLTTPWSDQVVAAGGYVQTPVRFTWLPEDGR